MIGRRVGATSRCRRFGRAIFAPSGEVAFLDLRTQLSRLKADYDVEWLDDESPDVRKLRAVRQRQAQGGPKEVELWFDPASGVIERLILRLLPRNNGGPRSLELVLLSSDPLPDANVCPPSETHGEHQHDEIHLGS